MKCVLQRVKWAKVEVDNAVVGEIAGGFLIYYGAEKSDAEDQLQSLADKIAKLRVFNDENYKMNRSLKDVEGAVLVVSQFTLPADLSRGNRPSFSNAMEPIMAKHYYEQLILAFKKIEIPVHSGIFGANMQVSSLNDGPVTFILGS